MRNFLSTFLMFSYAIASTNEVNLKLNQPIFKEKSASCTRGGIIKTDHITIYAKNFNYINEDGKHFVEASENLLVTYNGFVFIGDSISYDFDEQRGEIINGTGTIHNSITGGKRVMFFEDHSIEIEDAYITASPVDPPTFQMTSPLVTINSKTKASMKTAVGRLNGVPFMWLPSYGLTMDPKFKTAPTITYTARVENRQVPIIIARYKMYDDTNLQAYARLEYRFLFLDEKIKDYAGWYEGFGGALDFDYKTDDKRISLQSRNFASYNIWPLNIDPNRVAIRYRIQGKYKGDTNDSKVETFVQWDKLSDRFLRSDFKTQLFDIGTIQRNEAFVKYRTDPAFVSLYARPRLNHYLGFKQELPSFNVAVQPIEFFNTKIFLEQTYNGSYLNYLYASEIRDAIPDFDSGRLSSIINLYRPFNIGALNITPRVGFDGIFYSNNQHNDLSWQAVCSYGGDAGMEFSSQYHSFSHYIKPYVEYNGLTKPTSPNEQHYIFSIDDGYASYNQLLFGLNNEIYFDRFPVDLPTLGLNVRGMSFFDTRSFKDAVAKGDIDFIWHYPRVEFGTQFGWNFEKDTYDFINARFGWTINDYFALSLSFWDRGPYWWRKDNHESFVIDSYRTIDELAETPLSDARYCFVNKLQVQLAPLWTLQIENNAGKRPGLYNDLGQLMRPDQPYWVQTKFVLSMVLSNSYRVGLSYMMTNTIKDNAYNITIDLM